MTTGSQNLFFNVFKDCEKFGEIICDFRGFLFVFVLEDCTFLVISFVVSPFEIPAQPDKDWLRGATVARLTPDQKAACSNHVGVKIFFPQSDCDTFVQKVCLQWGLNSWPLVYKTNALPLSYRGLQQSGRNIVKLDFHNSQLENYREQNRCLLEIMLSLMFRIPVINYQLGVFRQGSMV